MKTLFFLIIVLGVLSSCSEQIANTTGNESNNPEQLSNGHIELKENSIDGFTLPFPEKDMSETLQKYYKSFYSLEAKVGQQDGPDFNYFDLLRGDDPVLYFEFDAENDLVLNTIVVLDSTVSDEYVLHVGDTFEKVKLKRGSGAIEFDTYHQHVYYHYEKSNISYELVGKLTLSAADQSMEDLLLTEKDLLGWTIKSIIWAQE
ncbi:MAG: DUF1131 family protein [Crocinitomicaceae bacterium]|nr:hypothetical protein [Flavobacteriales bacterium]NQZ35562.1 DUF1131 family protein [Crocinitomicaceae bacterium]